MWQKLLSHLRTWKKIMRCTRDQRHFENEFAEFLQTCNKSYHLTLRPEMKSCVSLETNDISHMNLHWYSRPMTKVAATPWELKSRRTPSRLQMFTGPQRKSYFFSPHKWGEQFMSHVCMNNATLFENVVGLHSNAWSHFSSQNETPTFVTHLHA